MANEALPQYMRIAMNIASRIARGEIRETQRLSGRSILSSEFNVSPETVRKALRLLADMGIVQVKEGSGTVVVSADKARQYLESLNARQEQTDLRNRLRDLFKEQSNLERQMLDIANNLIAASASPLPSDQSLPKYEVVVPEGSDKVGMSIGDLRFWQCTGATLVAIRRGQNLLISPGPYAELQAGDVLVYVGAPGCKQAVEQLLSNRAEKSLYRIQEQILTAIHMKELAVIAKALDAKLGDITDITSMTKGMTNRSYLFSCKGKRYILRIPGEGTDNIIDRAQEAEVYRAIAGTGLCDDVAYMNPKNGLKVTRFLEGVRNCDPYRDTDVRQAMDLLRRFHGLRLQVGHTFNLLEHIEFYESLREGAPSVHPDYEETKAHVLSLRDYIYAHRGEFCLTHIDAVPDNFLFHTREDGTEGLQLTDWEYAGMQDPHVDIAMFCIYSLYDREQVDQLIDLYFEGTCDRETRVKIYCYIAACGLLWSNWCEYKHGLGVDFGEYAQRQYGYAKEYYAIAREEIQSL